MSAPPRSATKLRPAGETDIPAIAAVWFHGWRDGHEGHVPDELVRARTSEFFRSRAAERIEHAVIADADGKVAGFVMIVDDEIEQLYVAREHRGTGVAALLLAEAERIVEGNGYGQAWLAVVPGNTRARRFYERHGWSDEGMIRYPAASATTPIFVAAFRYAKTLKGA